MVEICMKVFLGSENDGFNFDFCYWVGYSGKLNLINE